MKEPRKSIPAGLFWLCLLLLAAAPVDVAAEPSPRGSEGSLPPPGYMQQTMELIRQGRHLEARSRLLPVIEQHPAWPRAQFFLGLTFHKQHRYLEAERQFALTLRLDPQYHEVRVFRGWSLYYLGRLEDARSMFSTFLEQRPDYADAHFALGLIDFDEDDLDAAQRRFEHVVSLTDAGRARGIEAKARARLSDVLLRRGNLPAALAELERSIELNPANYESYFKLSRVLERLGRAEEAEQARQKHREMRHRARPMGDGP